MSNNPSIRWFWKDWITETGLRLSSLAARGLWFEMLALADQAKPRGFVLLHTGKPADAAALAFHVGNTTTEEVERLLAELERNGVFSRASDGTIYCRRMRREQTKGSPTRVLRQRRYREVARDTASKQNPGEVDNC